MNKISSKDIIEMLGITEQQFVMARYSGRLPAPDENGEWNHVDIDYILTRWNSMLETKRRLKCYDTKNLQSGEKMEFPKHSR